MENFTRDQKMAMLVVPMLLFGMLGVSYIAQSGRQNALHEVHATRGTEVPLRDAIESKDYGEFVKALHATPYEESATPEVFDTLVRMYALHRNGDHGKAGEYLHVALYGEGEADVV